MRKRPQHKVQLHAPAVQIAEKTPNFARKLGADPSRLAPSACRVFDAAQDSDQALANTAAHKAYLISHRSNSLDVYVYFVHPILVSLPLMTSGHISRMPIFTAGMPRPF